MSDPRHQGKSRVRLDLRPDDQEAEVERLLSLGARRADIGQGEQSWVVLPRITESSRCRRSADARLAEDCCSAMVAVMQSFSVKGEPSD